VSVDTIDHCYYVTDCVCVAWGNLANVLNADGRSMEAEHAYKAALRHRSNMADVHYNLYVSVSSSLTLQIFTKNSAFCDGTSQYGVPENLTTG